MSSEIGRQRKMNEEAHGDDRSERYSVETLLGEDTPKVRGPMSIGQLIAMDQARLFIVATADVSYHAADFDTASRHLATLRRLIDVPNDEELSMMATLGSKMDAYSEMLSPKIKDEHL